MWEKTNFYFENTNFLLKDADLILIFFFLKQSDFLLKTDQIFIWKNADQIFN